MVHNNKLTSSACAIMQRGNPPLLRPPPALTQNLPSLMDSVDVKHHVYFTNTEISRLKW